MLFQKISEARNYIKSKASLDPAHGIVLGTGLGALAKEIDITAVIPFAEIPHFPTPTVKSHKGELILGHLSGAPVAGLAGRFHYYEGYSMEEVTFPIRVLKFLGIHTLFISNAAGSVRADINPGDLVFINDHINLHASNPLRGANDPRLGPRFPDMLQAYDPKLNDLAIELAKKHHIQAHRGVYVGLQGPNLETPAEYNFLNIIGGAVVGMSSIPEVLVAKHMDLKVFMVSVATNKCFPIDEIQPATIESVIEVAEQAEPKLTTLIKSMLKEISKE